MSELAAVARLVAAGAGAVRFVVKVLINFFGVMSFKNPCFRGGPL